MLLNAVNSTELERGHQARPIPSRKGERPGDAAAAARAEESNPCAARFRH